MSNVISLRVPKRRLGFADQTETLAGVFASHRRVPDDVFWLKENAEFLNICECTGTGLSADAVEHWVEFYGDLQKRLRFFPQYYRFFLSIALDLEALGLSGSEAEAACAWVAAEGLAEAELSDLQRAEARRLLARRDQNTTAADPWIDDRLRAFIGRQATFALPNKKAAYELTHIVFYLSEYGRRDPLLPEGAIRSLEYAGLLALLEQNMDLLAEVCVALRFAGHIPPQCWEDSVVQGLAAFRFDPCAHAGADDYHEFLVSSWAALTAGQRATSAAALPECGRFEHVRLSEGPLRNLSAILMDLDRARSGDWQQMRHMLYEVIDDEGGSILAAAEQSTPHFDAFFEGFARARA